MEIPETVLTAASELLAPYMTAKELKRRVCANSDQPMVTLLRYDEAKARLNCSRTTLWRLIKQGKLSVYQANRAVHSRRIIKESVDALLNQNDCE